MGGGGMTAAIVQGCDGCPEFAYHMEPYVAWGEVRGEIRHNDCPHQDFGGPGFILGDATMCRHYRRHHMERPAQMDIFELMEVTHEQP